MPVKTRIENVLRKPRKCPRCKGEIWDIIYGTGDMDESDFLLRYRKNAIMGGDNVPRWPPLWACSCCCKRFRLVNPDGTDAPVKVKMLSKVRPAPADRICWETEKVSEALMAGGHDPFLHYRVDVLTNLGERESLRIIAVGPEDAENTAVNLVERGMVGLEGRECKEVKVRKE